MGSLSRRGFLGGAAAAVGVAAAGTLFTSTVFAGPAGAEGRRGLSVSGERFLLDGEPFQLVSGAVHYFRIHPDQWRDRLLRLRALGLNTVETYVAWNFHQPSKTRPDFGGWRDLPRFIRIAGELGLRVIVRPSPYICAEWEFGGLPSWLLADRELELRCLDPAYLKAVDAWYDELIPRLTPLEAGRGGPIIAAQIENEYGSYGNDTSYLAHLRDSMRARGLRSLLFAADGASEHYMRFGSLPGTLEVGTGDGDPKPSIDAIRKFQPGKPVMMAEFWDGWFDHWGERHNTRDPKEMAGYVDTLLSAGASVNLYMACGGTNFGFTSGANTSGKTYQPTITSYDYDSPVGEAGDLGAKFEAIRAVLDKHTELPPGPVPGKSPRLAAQTVKPDAAVSLLDSLAVLSKPIQKAHPVPMETVGQSTGLIHYRTTVQGPHRGPLSIHGLADRALVFLDGEQVGVLDRNAPDGKIDLTLPHERNRIDILVDAMGRVNYGPYLADRKGIDGWVALNTQQKLFGWEIRPLPLDDLAKLRFGAGAPGTGPAFHRATVTVPTPEDGFVALPGWEKGIVWLNGFNLGRYWKIGPQKTLYAPKPLWRAGRNELVVLELHQPGDTIEIRPEADLG
ncbi:glycoside hydrolase family 35 protein [Amycolatopsis sp. CA-230715]|uniref:glycoside hydrolase family 35 protein n=1 Tax=Amycolatopsis sp. CA-230715 TaxID=2745196 RepID=UPI001C027A61|nr:beta-galactosidase family protein [Amycolatopsis sp. CA-230715]QWF78760.1 Beta-galactosidase [Amycolatopsis sp. CA-230715]